jgi:hypothetical protein
MSYSYTRGKTFELKVASMIRKKLNAKVYRDKRSGAGTNRSDISDYANSIPIHIECKDQETVKIKEWFAQADAAASFTKAPTVVFAMDEEILATLRLSDLLNFLVEIADLRAEVDDLRQPVYTSQKEPQFATVMPAGGILPLAQIQKAKQRTTTCKNGHLADEYGYCQQKSCPYSRGYKKKKEKKS